MCMNCCYGITLSPYTPLILLELLFNKQKDLFTFLFPPQGIDLGLFLFVGNLYSALFM